MKDEIKKMIESDMNYYRRAIGRSIKEIEDDVKRKNYFLLVMDAEKLFAKALRLFELNSIKLSIEEKEKEVKK